jgi:uridine monophosphate synthetase
MQDTSFFPSLAAASALNDSLLCVGLDPSLDIPAPELLPRMRAIVDATHSFACAFKPNIAFFEARGPAGGEALKVLIDAIHAKGLPVILDAKRGDIASTADAYAVACFDVLGADALTVNPLLGGDSVESFACRKDRGVFLLCHTSNPGARDFQELDCGGAPLFETIAAKAQGWNSRGNIGLVVGATFPRQLEAVRAIAPEMWILLPGVGSQGGDLEASLAAGLRTDGSGVLVNISRGISQAKDPGAAARGFRDSINAARKGTSAKKRTGSPSKVAPAVAATLADEIALGLHDLGAVRFGEFTLKSGQKSPIYIDLRLLVSGPRLMGVAARAFAAIMRDLTYDRIAALPYGGLPIGQAVALATGKPLIYPRREVKEYGTKKLIEGAYTAGETVIVLDDLVTTGGSKIEAMAPLTEAGLKVTDVVVLVDREQGGRKELAEHGLTLHAALTLGQILDSLVAHGRITGTVRSDVRKALGLA